MQFFVFLSLSLTFVYRISGETWNYEELGPDVWSDTYPSCAKRSQSPINIRTACTTYRSFTPFTFSSSYDLTHNFTLLNNGHTVTSRYIGNGSSPLVLTGGNLNGTYEFLNFHLHWGENYKSGSEHQVNGVKYPGEIHFVHVNPVTLEIAVLGMFMESSRVTNMNETVHQQSKRSLYKTEDSTIDEWKRYFAVAENLQKENDSTVVSLNLASLMGDNLNDFWRYEGSLTTPPCTEGLIWTIFKTPIVFTESEFEGFRKNIFFEDYRGPQPLYDRVVHRNFLKETLSTIPDYGCCSKDFDYNSANILLFDQNSVSLVFMQFFFLIIIFIKFI